MLFIHMHNTLALDKAQYSVLRSKQEAHSLLSVCGRWYPWRWHEMMLRMRSWVRPEVMITISWMSTCLHTTVHSLCLCVCVHVLSMASRWSHMSFSITFCPVHFRQSLSLKLELSWPSVSSSNPPVSIPQSEQGEYIWICAILWLLTWVARYKSRSSHSHPLNSRFSSTPQHSKGLERGSIPLKIRIKINPMSHKGYWCAMKASLYH